jgi:hypothetical protein
MALELGLKKSQSLMTGFLLLGKIPNISGLIF